MKPQRAGGWAWWLSMLWAGIGAAASGFTFISSTQPVTVSSDGIPTWLGGPGSANVIWTAAVVAIAAWLVLTVPVLVAGRARLRSWELGRWLWTCAWIAGLLLMILTKLWADNLPERVTCGTDACGMVPYHGAAVVNFRELAICAAFLAIGAVMTWTLAGPEAIAQHFETERPDPGLRTGTAW